MSEKPVPPFVAVAFKCQHVPGYEKWLEPPEGAKEETRKANEAKRAAKAGVARFSGMITEISAAAPLLEQVFHARLGEDTVPVGHKFLEWLTNAYGENLVAGAAARRQPELVFLGFGIDELMSMACMEALQMGPLIVPLELWYHSSMTQPRHLIDPMRTLLPYSLRDHYTWQGFLAAVGIPDPDKWPIPGTDLDKDLSLTLQLAAKYQLYPRAPSAITEL